MRMEKIKIMTRQQAKTNKKNLKIDNTGVGEDADWDVHSLKVGMQNGTGILEEHMAVSSVQLSCSVMSDSLRPHESQHARPPCPSPTPGVYSNSCPSSQ